MFSLCKLGEWCKYPLSKDQLLRYLLLLRKGLGLYNISIDRSRMRVGGRLAESGLERRDDRLVPDLLAAVQEKGHVGE